MQIFLSALHSGTAFGDSVASILRTFDPLCVSPPPPPPHFFTRIPCFLFNSTSASVYRVAACLSRHFYTNCSSRCLRLQIKRRLRAPRAALPVRLMVFRVFPSVFFFLTPVLPTGGRLRAQVQVESGGTPPGSGSTVTHRRLSLPLQFRRGGTGQTRTHAVCLTYITSWASEWKRWHTFNKLVFFGGWKQSDTFCFPAVKR